MNPDIIKQMALTYEVCGTKPPSSGALDLMAHELSSFTDQQLSLALKRCRDEVKGFLSQADIVSRIDDGRPSAEEAYTICHQPETETIIWTEEMAQAWGVASQHISKGDTIAARMAFKEVYQRKVTEARTARQVPKWSVSLGFDTAGRERVMLEAYEAGKIGRDQYRKVLGYEPQEKGAVVSLAQLKGMMKQRG